MRCFLPLLLTFPILLAGQTDKSYVKNSQTNWGHGTVYFSDGREIDCNLRLIVSFNEGSLQLKKGEAEKTFSPLSINRFTFYDSSLLKQREFRSVDTKFKDRQGHKYCFQELIYEGTDYKLYRRFLPVAKVGGLILPNIGWAVWSYGEIQPSLFLCVRNGLAYEVAEGKNDSYVFEIDYLRYNLDKKTLKWMLGSDWVRVKKYTRKNKLNLSNEHGLTEMIKFLEGSSFQYDRENTPKHLRK